MKKRVLCALLSLMIFAGMITLPIQAAAKPAFQWLVDFTRQEGQYDAAGKVYDVSWYADESEQFTIAMEYDLTDGNLYCWIVQHIDETLLVLTPDLSAPYEMYVQRENGYVAEYSVYPGTYTEKTKLHFADYSGHEVYEGDADVQANAYLPLLLDSINNLMILSGTNYRIKDLGFAKFTYHSIHVNSEPEVAGGVKCGTNVYTYHCLICGKTGSYEDWEDHIRGKQVWEKQPTCTEWGNYYYVCARCGERIVDSGKNVEPLGHDWALISLDAPISDESHVQGQFRCKRCSKEKAGEYCAADFFKDMPARGNWAHTPIDWAFANGITTGTSATEFGPDKGCTRAHVVTFLWRAAGCPEPEQVKTKFTDVKPKAFYAKAVAWAVEEGITKGMSDTLFVPDATCTRGQIVTFLWRFKGSPASKKTGSVFTDLKSGAFYEKAVTWAVKNKVTNGMTSTTFCPDATCTRAQVVTFLYRAQKVSASKGLVGVSMPTAALMRWKNDGEALKTQIEGLGYDVTLQFADNMPDKQIEQIENMLADGAKVLVIAAVDGDALNPVLARAKAAGVKVIAYDRLIYGSDAISCYVTFDNRMVGALQGEYIEKALDLKNAGGKTYNIEFITGDARDGNVDLFYGGAMSVLQKYLDSGVLVCRSGQTAKQDAATEGWSSDNARNRFHTLLTQYYADQPLHAVLASNDSTAQGVAAALTDSYKNDIYPILTGQDCDLLSVRNMLDGRQAMSVFKDTRDLTAETARIVDAVMTGAEPPVNDTETFDNGTGIVPSFLCAPRVCTGDNIQELLIDSGFYAWEDLTR